MDSSMKRSGSCLWQDMLTVQGVDALSISGIGDVRPKLWAVVYIIGVDVDQVERVIEAVVSALPRETWYYGCREDHPYGCEGKHELVHTCLSLLVGSKNPFSPCSLYAAVSKSVLLVGLEGRVVVMVSPHHRTLSGVLCFRSVFEWVRGVQKHVIEERVSCAIDGLRRGLFGFPDILVLFRYQFGTVIDGYIVESLLEKESTDEQSGRGGGFELMSCTSRSLETVYVVTK